MREALFWPGMYADLKALVRQCDACLKEMESPSKEPLLSHDFPFDNRHLLFVVDYYSDFIEVSRVRNLTSKGIIKEIQNLFARHGIPDTLMTDNGPQFCTA